MIRLYARIQEFTTGSRFKSGRYQREMETKPQSGGHGGRGQSAETAAVNASVNPASNKSFLIMVEISLCFSDFEWELTGRLSPGSNGRHKVLHSFGKQNISFCSCPNALNKPFFSARFGV